MVILNCDHKYPKVSRRLLIKSRMLPFGSSWVPWNPADARELARLAVYKNTTVVRLDSMGLYFPRGPKGPLIRFLHGPAH